MKKFTKVTLTIAGILLTVGIVLLIIVDNTSSTSVLLNLLKKGVFNSENWNLKDGIQTEIQEVADAFHNVEKVLPKGKEETTNEFLEEIKNINIEFDLGKITIEEIEADDNPNIFKVVFCDGYLEYYEVKTEKDTLTITYDVESKNFEAGPELVVYVPRKSEFEKINIQTHVGDVDLDNINCKNMDISSNVGDIELENIMSEIAIVKSNVGDIDISGNVNNKVDAETKVGDIETHLNEKIENYNIEIETNTGKVIVNEKKQENKEVGASYSSSQQQASGNIILNSNVGDIKLQVKE